MPKYVYQNIATGEQYEFEQRFSDDPYTHHPQTGEPIRRLIFAPAVVFKGSGWYAKDSKAGGAAKTESASSDASAQAKTDAKAEKTEGKPDSSKTPTPAPNPSAE